MILQKRIARLVGFATCGSSRGSRNGGRRRRRPGAGAGRELEPRKSAALEGKREREATPLPDVVTMVNVLRTVDCVACVMPCY